MTKYVKPELLVDLFNRRNDTDYKDFDILVSDLYKGNSIRNIANVIGVSYSFLRSYIEKSKTIKTHKHGAISINWKGILENYNINNKTEFKTPRSLLLHLKKSGYSNKLISNILLVSESSVCKYLKSKNIKTKQC
jgi:hypothetical protein